MKRFGAKPSCKGLRRVEGACRAERLRRARRACPELDHPRLGPDPEDELLEALPQEVLAGIAERLARSIPGGPLA